MKNPPPAAADGGRKARRKYRAFGIPKRDGSTRKITAPCDVTKGEQKAILKWAEERYQPHKGVHGFTAAKGVRTAAIAAAEATCLVKDPKAFIVISIDLKDFFPSIKLSTVKRLFRKFGASRDEAQRMGYWATYQGGLPQGSPCSPIIANMAAGNLDTALQGLADSTDGCYIRYADDITLIVRRGHSSRDEWLAKTCKLIEAFGFIPHPDKRAVKPLAGHNGFEVVGVSLHLVKQGQCTMRPRRKTVRSARAALVCHKEEAPLIRGGYGQYLIGHQGTLTASRTREGYFPRFRSHTTFMARHDVATLCVKHPRVNGSCSGAAPLKPP